MKRTLLNRVALLVMAFAVAFTCVIVPASTEVSAASGQIELQDAGTLYAKCEYWSSLSLVPVKETEAGWAAFDKITRSATLVSVKSSSPKIIEAKKTGKSLNDYYLVPHKVGKSKITVKYKYNGKTYSMSKTCTVKKYPNPYKSIQVNGKKIDIKKNKYFYDVFKYGKNSAKVKITPKKGWKVRDAYVTAWSSKKSKYKELKSSEVTKGTAISIPKGWDGAVFVDLENSKGDVIQYGVRFSRGKKL